MPDVPVQAPPPKLTTHAPQAPLPPSPPPKKTFAAAATTSQSRGGWTVVQNKKAIRAPKKTPPVPTVDQRSFELVLTRPIRAPALEVENVISEVNRALHRGAIQDVRVERLRCTETGRILGITSPTSTFEGLLKHRDMVLKAARSVLGEASDLVPQQKRRWVKIQNISLVRCMGKMAGGLCLLREELEAENSGVSIPADIRWLSRAKTQARYQEFRGGTSSVVAVVLGGATFSRIYRSGVHLFGRRYEAEAFEEARPDAFCNRCSCWGHVAPHCLTALRCSICAEETPRRTTDAP